MTQPAPALPQNVVFVKSRGPIEQYRLKSNGMDILLVKSDAAPVITFLIVVRVGSRNEAPGNTGSAHLLEHMLFNKSTENFGKKSPGGKTIQEVLYEAGGDFSTSNMTTWCDRITMYDTLPADQLATTMKINADRLRRGKILDEERRTEMTVVRNEYERGENNSGEALLKAVVASAIIAHPYHWNTIGYKSDIEGVSTDQLREHYNTYFWPDNSTAVLVGDFETNAALALFDASFGSFPKAPKPIAAVHTTEPPQEGERRVTVRRAGAVPQATLAWLRPGAGDPEFYAFEVLGSILGDGVSARLYQSLVETRLATEVSTYNWAFRDPFLFMLNATLVAGSDPTRVEAEMRKVVDAVRTQGVTADEVARAKALIEAQLAFQREGTYGTAWTLGEAIAAGDWEWWVDYRDKIRAVTPAQVQAAANAHLGPDQVTVGWFVPKASGEEKTEAGLGGGTSAGSGAGARPGMKGSDVAADLDVGSGPRIPADPMPRARAGGPRYARSFFGDSTRISAVTGMHTAGGQPFYAADASASSGKGGASKAAARKPSGAKGSEPGAKGSSGGGKSFASRTIRKVLPNGPVLLLLPNALSETVSVRVRLRAGRYLDGERPGLAEATATMLGRGTKTHTKIEIAKRLESAGTSLSWGVDLTDVTGSGSCLSTHLPDLLDTIVEELRAPAFAEDEIAKLKEEMKVEILEDDDNTTRRAFDDLSRAVYPEKHPLRASTAKVRQDVLSALTGSDLGRFHADHYGAGSLVISVVGGFDTAIVQKQLEQLLGSIPRGKAAPITTERLAAGSRLAPAAPAGQRIRVPMKDKANVDIVIGGAGALRRTDPDYYAATLANAVLGQSGLSSRLGRQVRDTEGLTYTIVSRFFSPYLVDGPWGIYLSVAPPNVDRGIESSMNVLRGYVKDGMSEEELRVEKSAAAGRFQVSLANNAGVAEALAQAESYGLGVSLLDEYPSKVRSVTVDEANRALRSHILPDKVITVVAGSISG